MEQKNNLSDHAGNQLSPVKPVLIGAGIALILISMFLSSVDHPKPEWGKLWMLKPMIMVPVAGAIGGLFYYFMNYLSSRSGFNKTVAILLSFIVYIIVLWLGSVLGLNGTLWN
jgi:H+/Cl- antiporter ClcA